MMQQGQAVAVEAQEAFVWFDTNAVAHNSARDKPV
jgi:hypothetical protein